MIDYDKELNEQQCAVVRADPGPILVIAGAGSGKTRTLTYRVAYLIENGIPPERLLLLTFTNKAAREMLSRVANLMPLDATRIWGGTFHSIANRILRRHPREVGYEPGFAILDREDSKDLIQSCYGEAGVNPKEKRFPKPDVLIEMFSMGTNTERKLPELLEKQYEYFGDITDPVMSIHRLYRERKRRANVMDYDDLLSFFLQLLREHPQAAEVYGKQFMSIMVDEFQDTNRLQSDIVDALASHHQNIMVVGDDAQSIYSWRGANFRNIMEFPKRYPSAKVFKIEHNYRSTPQILELANQSIAVNVNQFEKVLQATREAGMKPHLVPVLNASEQSGFIVAQILELRDQGMPLNEMAILYRSHFHSMELQMELTRRNIPFLITSGIRFFEQAHIKDVCAYLKLALNPTDEIAFKRIVLRMPKVGNATAQKLWTKLQNPASGKSGKSRDTQKELIPTGSDHLKNYQRLTPDLPKPAQDEWVQFSETMKQLQDPELLKTPGKMIRMVLEAGYDDHLKSKYENFMSRREDLEQLALFSSRFQSTEDLLSELSLMTNVEAEEGGPNERQDDEYLRLSTVHQAKGQEFQAVFVIWLTEGSFPNTRALESGEGEEEERRLFYVAVTRAKDELFLIYPQIKLTGGYGDAFQSPSRFLAEIPSKFYDKLEFERGYV